MLGEAATVGEYLSVTVGRVLRNMAASRNELRRRAGGDRRRRRLHRRPRRVRRAVGREHGARSGVALRRPRPAHRALAGRARSRRRLPAPAAGRGRIDGHRRARGERCRRPRRARGAAGGEREPRRLSPAPPQRRRGDGGDGHAPRTTRTTHARTSRRSPGWPTTWRRSTGRRGAGPWPDWPALVDDEGDVLGAVAAASAAVEQFGRARRRDLVRHARQPDGRARPDPVMPARRRGRPATASGTAPRTSTAGRWPTATPWPTCCRGPTALQVVESRRGHGGADARRAGGAHRRVRQPRAAARRPPRPRHADAARPERGRRRARRRDVARRAVGGRRRCASASCAAATPRRAPVRRQLAVRAARRARRRRCGRSPRRRSRRTARSSTARASCATSSTSVRVRPVVHRGVDAAVGRARRPARRVPGLRPPRRRLPALARAGRPVRQRVHRDRPADRAGPRLVGADASHAWCSVWVPQQGWIDFDPTNDHLPTHRHVTVAWGRDYGDVAPVRGVVIGPAVDQELTVEVDVERRRTRRDDRPSVPVTRVAHRGGDQTALGSARRRRRPIHDGTPSCRRPD